jgi:hypothetical protein
MWLRSCTFKLDTCANAFPQSANEHTSGFSPVCVRMWASKSLCDRNVFPQILHDPGCLKFTPARASVVVSLPVLIEAPGLNLFAAEPSLGELKCCRLKRFCPTAIVGDGRSISGVSGSIGAGTRDGSGTPVAACPCNQRLILAKSCTWLLDRNAQARTVENQGKVECEESWLSSLHDTLCRQPRYQYCIGCSDDSSRSQ